MQKRKPTVNNYKSNATLFVQIHSIFNFHYALQILELNYTVVFIDYLEDFLYGFKILTFFGPSTSKQHTIHQTQLLQQIEQESKKQRNKHRLPPEDNGQDGHSS